MALEQTTLFDALLGGAPCDNPVKEGSASRQAQHLWQEVPQARFLSWSDARQRAYCALRDKDSMTMEQAA